MKRKQPKQRPVKKRVPRKHQAPKQVEVNDKISHILAGLSRTVEALVEAVGTERVRTATARLNAKRSLAALANYTAAGKLVEVREVAQPQTCAVEFSESDKDGIVLTPSLVAELASIEPDKAAMFAGKRVGDTFEMNDIIVRVVRAWNVVEVPPPAPGQPLDVTQ